MDNITVRPMTVADRQTVQAFFDNMEDKSSRFFNVNHGNEKRVMGHFDKTTRDHLFFVATDGEELAGIMFIWDLQKSVPWFGIAVSDKFQGRGIGTTMIKYLSDYLTQNGYGGLLLRTHTENLPAQRLYEKCGFEKIGVHFSGELLYILRLDK